MTQKGYEEVIVQDISLKTDNVLFRQQKYYSASQGKTYLAPLPIGDDGEFGPGIKALVMSLYYGVARLRGKLPPQSCLGNMTQGKLLEFLENIGISMSAFTDEVFSRALPLNGYIIFSLPLFIERIPLFIN